MHIFEDEGAAQSATALVVFWLCCNASCIPQHAATKPEDVPAVTVQAVAAVLKGVGSLAMDDGGTRVKRTTVCCACMT